MMSAVATSACAASQGTKDGCSRSPSIRMSESMSQGIFRLLVKLPYLGFDCVRRPLVGLQSPVGPEQAGGPLPVHEVCIGHQPGYGFPMLADQDRFPVLGLIQKLMKSSCHVARGGFDHALKYIFYVILQACFPKMSSKRMRPQCLDLGSPRDMTAVAVPVQEGVEQTGRECKTSLRYLY